MKKKIIIFALIVVGIFLSAFFIFTNISKENKQSSLPGVKEQNIPATNFNNNANANKITNQNANVNYNAPLSDAGNNNLSKVILPVPYINEAPDDNWTGPWKNACEEASMAMAEKYYQSQKTVTISEAKAFMNILFAKQNILYGSNADSDTVRTARLINDYTVYNAIIIDNPTLEEIKKELQQKRPVISFHYGKDLNNKNIPFLATGSYYHVMAIIGYDDNAQEFIVNDTGDRVAGAGHRYDYNLFLNSLHDFSFITRRADGPARVIFTYPKFAKTADSPKVYYLHGNISQYVADPEVFRLKGWSWYAINTVDKNWLNTFTVGEDITADSVK